MSHGPVLQTLFRTVDKQFQEYLRTANLGCLDMLAINWVDEEKGMERANATLYKSMVDKMQKAAMKTARADSKTAFACIPTG